MCCTARGALATEGLLRRLIRPATSCPGITSSELPRFRTSPHIGCCCVTTVSPEYGFLINAEKMPTRWHDRLGVGRLGSLVKRPPPRIGKGGVAQASECSAAKKGTKEIVRHQADYIFLKAA